jgi:5-methylthioadenosine/S-adenosylhomocysteine deaminase
MRTAILSKYLFYSDVLHTDAYLIIDQDKIVGLAQDKDDPMLRDCQVIDRSSCLMMPGLLNMHGHSGMVMFRGLADDIPLRNWLEKYMWPLESQFVTEEFIRDASMLAACEMIRSGTVLINDMYYHSRIGGLAVAEVGMRAVIGQSIFDFATKFGSGPDEYLQRAKSLAAEFRDHSLIDVAIAPHALYTTSPQTIAKATELAHAEDLSLHMHVAETQWEIDETRKKYGKHPIEILQSVDALSARTVLAHCVHVDDPHIEVLSKTKANVVHCLHSNLKLASGIAPVVRMQKAGINIALGTDGAASNNSLDLISELSLVAKIHKATAHDATVIPAHIVFDFATKNAAKALRAKDLGKLSPGKKADFLIMDLTGAHATPVYDPVSHFVYSAKSTDIRDVFINGRHVLKDKVITTIDESAIIKRVQRSSEKILGAVSRQK